MTTQPVQIFVCHASEDKPQVRELVQKLRAAGFDSWLDDERLLPGHDWDAEIADATANSGVVLVCLSATSVGKVGYVQKELRRVLDLAEYQPEGRLFLIPVRLENCEVPARLRHWQYADVFLAGGFERLCDALGGRVSVPSTQIPIALPAKPRFHKWLLALLAGVVLIAALALQYLRPINLTISTVPQAVISMDGTRLGESSADGTFLIQKPPKGSHTISISAYNYRDYARTLDLGAGTTHLTATLQEVTGDLQIFTAPGAQVFVDGKQRGLADGKGQLLVKGVKAGPAKIECRQPSFLSTTQNIDVKGDAVNPFTVELKARQAMASSSTLPAPRYSLRFSLPSTDAFARFFGVFFLPDDTSLAAWSDDGKIAIYDSKTGRRTRTIEVGMANHFYALSPDLKTAAFHFYYGHEIGNKIGWGILQGTFKPAVPGYLALFTSDSKTLLIADGHGPEAMLWDVTSHKLLRRLRDPSIGEAGWSRDGKRLATAKDAVVSLWDPNTGRKVSEWKLAQSYEMRSLVFSPDSSRLAVIARDYTLLFDTVTGKPGPVIPAPASDEDSAQFHDAVFNSGGAFLITSNNANLHIYDASSGEQAGSALDQGSGYMAITQDGSHIAVAEDHSLAIWGRD